MNFLKKYKRKIADSIILKQHQRDIEFLVNEVPLEYLLKYSKLDTSYFSNTDICNYRDTKIVIENNCINTFMGKLRAILKEDKIYSREELDDDDYNDDYDDDI